MHRLKWFQVKNVWPAHDRREFSFQFKVFMKEILIKSRNCLQKKIEQENYREKITKKGTIVVVVFSSKTKGEISGCAQYTRSHGIHARNES